MHRGAADGVFALGDATNLPTSKAGSVAHFQAGMEDLDLPGAREMIEILEESGARLYACELAMDMFGRELSDLLPQVEDVITAGDFYETADGAQIIFT